MGQFSQKKGANKLAQRFRAAFTAVTVITACIGATAYFGSLRLVSAGQAIYSNDVIVLGNLSRAIVQMKHMRLIQYRLLNSTDPDYQQIHAFHSESQAAQRAQIALAEADADKLIANCEPAFSKDASVSNKQFEELLTLWRAYKKRSEDFAFAIQSGDRQNADRLLSGDLMDIGQAMNGATDKVFAKCDAAAAGDATGLQKIALWGRLFVAFAVLSALALYIALWRSVARYVVEPAREIRDSLNAIASGPLESLQLGMIALSEGDFSRPISTEMQRLSVHSDDEFGVTAQAINLLSDRVDSIAASYGRAREALDELVAVLSSASPDSFEALTDDGRPVRSIRHATGAIDSVLAHQADLEALAYEANRLAEESSALMRAKSNFLANMSHELRTPMNGVLGAASLLTESELDREQAELVDIIRTSGSMLLAIVNDVLDFSKLEAGKMVIESVPLDPSEVAWECRRSFETAADQKGLALNLSVEGENIPVLSDPMRLRQVLNNLIGNAIKFTNQGHVLVRCGTTPVSDDLALVRIDVEDTGIGIDGSVLERIFDHFTQADASTTRTFGGTGLGLAISKQLVESMGGTLSVSSELGVGSTFSVELSLPLAATQDATSEIRAINYEVKGAKSRSPESNGPVRVLMAEDNPVNQIVGTKILKSRGYDVTTVANGLEALGALRERSYHVVLMDWHMPQMDGLEASRAIRASDEDRRAIPIIALTANAMEGDRATCLAAGMDDYVSKPFQIDELLNAVSKWTSRRHAA